MDDASLLRSLSFDRFEIQEIESAAAKEGETIHDFIFGATLDRSDKVNSGG